MFFYSMGLKKTLLETCNSRDKTGVHGPAFLLSHKLIATHCYFWQQFCTDQGALEETELHCIKKNKLKTAQFIIIQSVNYI
jgi:hypothetical protein